MPRKVITDGKLQAGDILELKTEDGHHIAIYVHDNRVNVKAEGSGKLVVERGSSYYISCRVEDK